MSKPRGNKHITAEYLRQVLSYCPTTGIFTWKYREDADKRWNIRYAGKRAGTYGSGGGSGNGYVHIFINCRGYGAHRLAWLYIHSEWPKHAIDHADSNGLNNAIGNLREATYRENSYNRRIRSDNASGFKGVYWQKSHKKWGASIVANGKTTFLGLFGTAEEAHESYCIAAERLHGKFARAA